MKNDRIIDRIRDELWMVFHGGRKQVLGYREDSLAWYEELIDRWDTFSAADQELLESWQKENMDGCTIATSHWPGWYEHGLRVPPSYGKGEGRGIGAPRSYFADAVAGLQPDLERARREYPVNEQ